MQYINYVNPKMGTNSLYACSRGNVLPVMGMPFGMSSFAVETRGYTHTLFYNPNDVVTNGIRLTHMPCPWINDYGNFTMMAATGDRVDLGMLGRSSFRTDKTIMTPARIKMRLLRYRCEMDMVPTLRGALCRVKWDESEPTHRFVIFNNTTFEVHFEIDPQNRRLTGYTRANTGSVPENFAEHFVIEFDRDFDLSKTVIRDRENKEYDVNSPATGNGISISIAFANDGKDEVEFRLATSFISQEQASVTFDSELKNNNFDELLIAAENEWEKYLSKLEIESDNEEQKRTFYSCLYRMFLYPRVFHEIDANGKMLHYSTATGKVCSGPAYVDNGFWDTAKTVYPLYSIIAPDKFREMVDAFLCYYDESGWLPKWLSPGEKGAMPGTMIDCVFADAVINGVVTDKEKIKKMYKAMLKHATVEPHCGVHGRDGIEEFNRIKYATNEVAESVNKTQDYAYGDFCIARIAEYLGDSENAKLFYERSLYYRNLFDPETGFLRAKDENGKMRDDFSEFDWGGDYCEGGPWQNSWAQPHDILGMAMLQGGRVNMVQKMDKLFATPPYFNVYGYPHEIHEMTEMAIADFGQCALSDQPSFHIPYIFSAIGAKDKTAFWVRRMLKEMFNSGVDGFPGDDDNGSMSGWYVFSTMGFYPFCNGTGEFVLGAPAVKKCTIHLADGKDFVITAPENSSDKFYVKTIRLNDVELHRTFIRFDEIKKGGTLDADMSAFPKMEEFSADALPYSLSEEMLKK